MDKILSDLLNGLSTMTHPEISDVNLQDGYLSFKYRGGTFYIYKNFQSTILDIGYLKVYHKTPILVDLKEIEGFYIWADKYGQIKITNHTNTAHLNPVLQAVVTDGLIPVYTDSLPTSFVIQFHAKMLKDNFSITPFSYK